MLKDVDTTALERLLDLQTEDTAIKRLHERRASLPEAARLAEVTSNLEELRADLDLATRQLEQINREQSRFEGEIELLEQKTQREEQRLFAGAVTNPKELSALQAEVEMLKRKRATLEDELLEVLVQKDQAVETEARLRAEHQSTATEAESLTATVGALTEEINSSLATHTGNRESIAAGVPSDLLELYEKLRVAKGGVGAAALIGGMCEGCHTKIPSKEAERIRAERGLQRCDNCRRILVVV